MPDKKVATQASDGPWERETIITFNDAEKKASYYTCNKARMLYIVVQYIYWLK